MAVFLVLSLIVVNFWILGNKAQGQSLADIPAYGSAATGSGEDLPAILEGGPLLADNASQSVSDPALNSFVLESGALGGNHPSSGPVGSLGSVITYAVKRGDSLSSIAARFGISVQTVLNANPGIKKGRVRVGQELSILPVSGILYSVRDGETAESVASSFGLTVNQLQQFNPGAGLSGIGQGTVLVIPGASAQGDFSESGKGLADLGNYFVAPAKGFNWGILHPHNAVDIAAACGTPITASAEGLVSDVSVDDWSSGYGHYVQIEHPNGVKTKYAHMNKIAVSLGDYVKQGDTLGTMGETGDATGCHVHFEVEGAKNPFAK